MPRVIKFILELTFWMVAAGALVFGAAILIGLGFSPALGFVGACTVLVLVPVSMRIAMHARQRRAAMVVSYLEQAARMNLPLPRMLWAAQRSESGKSALRLAQLRERMEDGLPIGAALELSVPEIPDRSIAIVSAAERMGRLSHALKRLLDEQTASARRDTLDTVFYRVYPAVMVLMVSLIVSMVSVYVLPKFQTIFRDFGVAMPAITTRTFQIAYALAPLLLIVAFLWVLGMAGRTMWETFHPLRFGQTVFHVVMQHVLWWLPVTHALERDRGLADLFDFLAEAVGAQAPMDKALAEASSLKVNIVLKEKVARWGQQVAQGMPMHEAARDCGMPEIVWGMLGTAHHRDDAANVLWFLSRYYGSRFSRAASLVHGATVPVIVLCFGVIVGVVALSMFVPMITLLSAVSAHTRMGAL